MKRSTFVSYFFFVVAILLEVLSQNNAVSDLRLFVGVFVVMGIAFLIYSIQETIQFSNSLIFNRNSIAKSALVKAKGGEYMLDKSHPYLWIPHSIYLDWDSESKIKKIRNGIFAALGGQHLSSQNDNYIVFELEGDVYFREGSEQVLMESGSVKIIKKGPAYRYYSKTSIYSMIITLLLLALSVLAMIVYIAVQMFK